MAAKTMKSRMPLREAYEAGQLARDVQMAPGSRSLTLSDLLLVEDDGPGARALSLAWPTTWETVAGGRQARKVLHVARPEALGATLVFNGNPARGESEPLKIAVNGHVLTYRDPYGDGDTGVWHHVPVSAQWLRKGRNDIVFSCDGPGGWWLSIAPHREIVLNAPERKAVAGSRSELSVDHGRTWGRGLGPDAEQAGEYMVRLSVRQYRKQGELIGPVIDLGATDAESDGASVAGSVRVRSLAVRATGKKPSGTSVQLHVRTGSSPLYDDASWGPWRACRGGRATPSRADHRFAQWRVTLSTGNPKASPEVTGVEVQARVEPALPAWAKGIRLTDGHNESVRYTSIPFEYERFDLPQLKSLRRKFKLDRVIAGAKDELEAIRRLRHWVATRWDWAPPGHPYPLWDAHDILGRKDGMCVHFAIALMQCALAVGLQARFTFGGFQHATVGGKHQGGHEVTEVWSNQFGKWVYMDATSTRDECFLDRRTGVPLSMLEFHDETMRLYLGTRPAPLEGVRAKAEKRSPRLRVWSKDNARPTEGPAPVRLRWGPVYWMSRNNFYARRRPEPIAQGRVHWCWPGYRVWWDAQTPRKPWFDHHTCRRSDLAWTINQLRFAAEYSDEPGVVTLRLSTVTPDFETFLVSIDGGPWTAVGDSVPWRLGPGGNRIEMRVRNRAGVLGNTSWLELEWGA